MDLRTSLKESDLFVSYYFDKELLITIGDKRQIYSVNKVPISNIAELIVQFNQYVNEFYYNFIDESYAKEKINPSLREIKLKPFQNIISEMSPLVITETLSSLVINQRYRRLIVFPDKYLHSIPIHMLLNPTNGNRLYENFPDGIIYAPNASSYIYSCMKKRSTVPRHGLILVGDASDKKLYDEAENVKREIPCPTEIISKMSDLKEVNFETDLLYIATHGQSLGITNTPSFEQNDDVGWRMLFDDQIIEPRHFFNGLIKLSYGATVLLASCDVGSILPGPHHELQGLVRALFYSGAATIIGARWPILYETAEAVFLGTISKVFKERLSFGTAMTQAINESSKRTEFQRLMRNPQSFTWFWGPFTLFGSGE